MMTLKNSALVALALSLFAPALLSAGKCRGGPDDGKTCSIQADCHNWCKGGPRNFQFCSSQAECPSTCQGGNNNGSVCTINSDCTSGGGFCHLNPCTLSPCILNSSFTALTADFAGCSSSAPEDLFLP